MTEETARVIVEINDKKAAEKIQKLTEKAQDLREQLKKATEMKDEGAIDNISKKLREVGRQIDQVRSRADKVRAAMRNLDEATPKQLKETIRAITAELNSGKIKRGSLEWNAYITKLKAAKSELSKIQAEMTVTTTKTARLRDMVNSWGATIAATVAGFTGLVLTGKKAVETYAEMQQEEANVRKFTGMTADEVERLNNEFKKLDTRTSRQELNKLAQEAGRLGKTSQEDVMGFVRAADKINVALDDLGDGATLTLSKLTGVFGEEARYGTGQSLLKVGSVINELSQNCSAGAPYLAEFTSRMGGVGAQANMTIPQIMAYGAVLDENMQKVEASATALSQVIVRLYQDPAKYAKVAGLDVKEFSELMKRDANEAILTLLETLNKAGGMDVLSPMFKDMGENGSRAIQALSTLANKIDKVRWQQQEANKAFEEGTSIANEFEVQNTTAQAGLDKARKGFTEVAVALGKELLPVMRYCISGTSMMMRTLLTLIQFIKEYRGLLTVLAMSVIAYTVAIKAAAISTVAHTAALKIQNVALKGLRATYLLMITALQLFRGNTVKATAAFRLFNITLKTNPIGLVVAAITAAVTALAVYSSRTREVVNAEKELNSIRKDAVKEMAEEKGKIDLLIKAASDETVSMSNRLHAVNELNRIIPNYNAQIDETTGKYKASKEALDEYLESLRKKYEIEGAKKKLAQYGEEYADLAIRREELKQLQEAEEKHQKAAMSAASWQGSGLVSMSSATSVAGAENFEEKLADIDRKLEVIKKKEDIVFGTYKEGLLPFGKKDDSSGSEGGGNFTQKPEELSEKEMKKLRKEREKALKEEAKRAKAEMLQAIADVQVMREQSIAENTAMYAAGVKDYRQFMEDEHNIRLKSIQDEKAIYEQRGDVSSKAYAKLIKEETDLLYKFSQAKRKLSIQEIEREKKQREDFLTLAYSTPKSALFGNDEAFRQKMLEAEIDFLEKKKMLYAAGSEEYEKISIEIEQKLADDKLQKQKGIAKAYEAWRKLYESASGSEREKQELAQVKALLDAELISEVQYQQAVNDIKEKYAQEERERLRKTKSEYGDMVLNIADSFRKLFEDIKDGGKLSLDNLASATAAAFAAMSAVVQSYSSYVNAERDAELAKVEERFDREIAAAGNNSKKKEKIEKEKEKETAKVKNKYAKRQQNVEIATALANTAMAALNAYASTAQIPIIGPNIAPIAAAIATAFGMMQVATIKKQYAANQGYYSGGFTKRDPNNRREVGVVHANEFVANHEAVNNAALSPVLRLIDYAQRNNRVASLTAADVSNAIGQGSGVSARGALVPHSPVVVQAPQVSGNRPDSGLLEKVGESIDKLNRSIENGIETYAVLDGERGLASKLNRYNKLMNNPKRK